MPSCPRGARLVLAAINGPFALSEQESDHVRGAPCVLCEEQLYLAWSRMCVSRDLLALAASWPASSPLGAAIRRHARECDSSACGAFVAAVSTEPSTAPRPMIRDKSPTDLHAKAKALAERWLARVGGVLVPDGFHKPAVAMGPSQQTARRRNVRSARRMRHGLAQLSGLHRVPSRGDRVRMDVYFDRLKGIRSGPVVVLVLLEGADQPLAEARFARHPGVTKALSCPCQRGSYQPRKRASRSGSCVFDAPLWRSGWYSARLRGHRRLRRARGWAIHLADVLEA